MNELIKLNPKDVELADNHNGYGTIVKKCDLYFNYESVFINNEIVSQLISTKVVMLVDLLNTDGDFVDNEIITFEGEKTIDIDKISIYLGNISIDFNDYRYIIDVNRKLVEMSMR